MIYQQIALVGAFAAGLSTAFLDVDRDHFSPVAEALFGVGVRAGPALLLTGLLLLIFDLRAARRR